MKPCQQTWTLDRNKIAILAHNTGGDQLKPSPPPNARMALAFEWDKLIEQMPSPSVRESEQGATTCFDC